MKPECKMSPAVRGADGERPRHAGVSMEEVDEIIHLYNSWFACLLRRTGEREVRVKAGELRDALRGFSCRIERDGGAYVIHVEVTERGTGGEANAGE